MLVKYFGFLILINGFIQASQLRDDNQILSFDQAIEPTIDPEQVCSSYEELTEQQRSICSRYPHATASAMQGLTLAVHECKRQFNQNRWNCSNLNETITKHPFLTSGYKEASFAHAIIAAGVLHQIARACSIGKIQSCGCENNGVNQFEWQGCSHDLAFGAKYSRKFLQDRDESMQSLLQAHNMRIGRKAVMDQKVKKCRCHGPSSSCEVKTCWLSTPDFQAVGDRIKIQYDDSIQVDRSNSISNQIDFRSSGFDSSVLMPSADELQDRNLKRYLVFYEQSPTYCLNLQDYGVSGTMGRTCNKTASFLAENRCDVLCCGRGYFEVKVRRIEKCNCKFYWCCYVVCQKCERDEWVTICK